MIKDYGIHGLALRSPVWRPGGQDVLINDENQVLSLREVTRVTLYCWDGHHYVRTSDITVPGPSPGHSVGVTRVITGPDIIIIGSEDNLHFISLTSVCSENSAEKVTR